MQIFPLYRPSQFYLVLDVTNLTVQEMLLNYTFNKNIVIEARESCRVPVPVERCSLFDCKEDPEERQPCSKCQQNRIQNPENSYIFPFHTVVYPFKEEMDTNQRMCSEHISNLVQLSWSLLGTEIKGTTSLKGITLSSTMLGLITVPPLKWGKSHSSNFYQLNLHCFLCIFASDVFINQSNYPASSELTCSTGQSVSLRVEICNQSPNELNDLILSIQFYQDYQNGTTKFQLETRVATSGPNELVSTHNCPFDRCIYLLFSHNFRVFIRSLKTNEKAQHECAAIFFTAGRFKTNIECGHMSSIAHAQQQQQQQYTSLGAIAPTVGHNNDTDSQIWRYIPAPEITVVE